MEAFTGQINLWAPTYAPVGWSYCNGALLPISQYSALFYLIQALYGGDGKTNFALPDLRSRFAVGAGPAASGTNYVLSQTGGVTTAALTQTNMPSHSHSATVQSTTTATLKAAVSNGTNTSPQVNQGLSTPTTVGSNVPTLKIYGPAPTTGMVQLGGGAGAVTSASLVIQSSGGSGAPYNTLQPYQGISHIICLEGTFPPLDS